MLRDGSVGYEASWCGVESGRDERCEKLHRKLKRIVKARAALDAEEAEALREAERLRMWRYYGYGSLLEYMEMELGYTPRAITLGFSKHEVREALERARTHVGRAALSTEQWIKIALSYCPKPLAR